MVLESIYDPEFPDTSHFRSGRGSHSVLRRIKKKWGTSRWFLEFDIKKSFHTIDRHRLISIFKEEIDDPKFFDSMQKVFYAGRGGEKGLYSISHSVLLSALPGNIYLHKLDQEIGTIRLKYEIPIINRIISVPCWTGRIDDQENSVEEGSFNTTQDNRVIIVGRSIPLHPFHSLLLSWHTFSTSTPRLIGDQKGPFGFPPLSDFSVFQHKGASPLCAAFLMEASGVTPKAEFYGGEGCNKNWTMRYFFQSYKRRDLLIELGGGAKLVFSSEKSLARKLDPNKNHYNIKIYYVRCADNLLLGILGAIELLLEIQKRINHFLQSGLNLWVGSPGSRTIAARSTIEFLGTVIRKVSPKTTSIQFLRELEKRLRVKNRIHRTACHLRSVIHSKSRNLENSIPIKELTKGLYGRDSPLDAVQLAETLGTAGVISLEMSLLWGTIKHIRQRSKKIFLLHSSGFRKGPSDVQERSSTHAPKVSLYTPTGRRASGERGGHWARSIHRKFPIQIEAPIKKILRKLRDRGLISRRRPWPIHVACLTNVSDGDIVNWYAGIAISLLFYYKYRDNLYQVRRIVDHQIRWSAIFTSAHKHKTSVRNIIPKYSKDSNIVNQESGKTLSEFPNGKELAKLRSGQDPKKKD